MIYRFLPDAIYALEPNAHFRINGNFSYDLQCGATQCAKRRLGKKN